MQVLFLHLRQVMHRAIAEDEGITGAVFIHEISAHVIIRQVHLRPVGQADAVFIQVLNKGLFGSRIEVVVFQQVAVLFFQRLVALLVVDVAVHQ